MSRRWILYLLSAVPVAGSLIVVNTEQPYVLGLPMVVFWAALWVLLTTVVMTVVYFLDPANREPDEPADEHGEFAGDAAPSATADGAAR
ncbi:DUF3311 domain-containing protein [Streptomyces endophyticus]|uniref:DUF3311 domain-containing protein n=1 Tax=Streptomyces endophyticus TaxID=714166 RepID=A0ABU6FBE4_9ACTN|nr:DUF3311 domain-containing protein [Streptomyces endophyticus]MEB8340798.1 DUF3311 domain-containing protein [Streptomyces endophyticus]